MIVQTASEALARYQDFLARDALVQKSWHTEKDGRQLACALGVLGDNLNGVRDCPAQVMPRWLAQHVVWFFDGQDIGDAKYWGARFYAELARVNGNVPFSVVHDWQANFVCPLAIEVAQRRKSDAARHAAVQKLHQRALAGNRAGKEEWVAELRPAYADADAYANAYADADADAYAYAYANSNANTYANAYTYATQRAVNRLADGMIECMSRLAA